MRLIKTIIVDDEPLACRRLKSLLSVEPDVRVVAQAGNGTEALRLINELQPDLVFLDVQMPELDGVSVAGRCIGKPVIVFVTAFEAHAVSAFEVEAADYLLKPFDAGRLAKTLARVRGRLERSHFPAGPDGHLAVRERGAVRFIPLAEIRMVRAAGNYVEVFWSGGNHLLAATMAQLEERLQGRSFLRTHRSYIVRPAHIEKVTSTGHGDALIRLRGGLEALLSRRYRNALNGRVADAGDIGRSGIRRSPPTA